MADTPLKRYAFIEEYGEQMYVQIIVSGPITAETLIAISSFVERQKVRIRTIRVSDRAKQWN